MTAEPARRFQFSLRTALVLLVLVVPCIVLLSRNATTIARAVAEMAVPVIAIAPLLLLYLWPFVLLAFFVWITPKRN
jgi:predicted nuclease with RNAse H fold